MKTTVLDNMTEGDTVRISVEVKNDDGTALDITDAAIECWAGTNSSTVEAAGTAITDGAAGILQVVFNAGDLTAGLWFVQVQVTLTSGDVQTVAWGRLNIDRSYVP